MRTPESEIKKYLDAFFSENDLTADALREGEEHYTPPTKNALKKSGLTDEDEQLIKEAVRTGQAIVENNEGFYKAPPAWLKLICSKLNSGGEASDQVNDALTIATTLLPLVSAWSAAGPYFSCALIAFTAVRMGVRITCSNLKDPS
jgi:hypothetical protein